MLTAQEEDETALQAKLKDFQISITRMDAAEVAAEIEHAEKQELPKGEAEEEPAALPEGEAPADN